MHRLALLSTTIATNQTSYSKIIVEKKDKVATIWLNSPKDLNCLSVTMAHELKTALEDAGNDRSIKVIVLRSKNSKIFCAGADIKNMQ